MNCPSYVKRMAREDIEDLLERINERNEGLNAEPVYYDFDAELTEQDPYEKAIDCWCETTIRFGSSPKYELDFITEYLCLDDDVYSAGDLDEWEEALEDKMLSKEDAYVVEASKRLKGQRITAAEDDEDPDMMDFGDVDEGLDDTLDDMADNIEDMQESMEDIQEDDVNIDVDNNIAGHYIAECDKCHGIFISAVSESEEEIEKITGVCPLCGKESEQFLRWVVHEVE